MKITKVELYKVMPTEPPSAGWRPTCVKVYTDEGIYGWGESGISVLSGRDAAAAFITEIAPMVLGMDPLDTEKIWSKLYQYAYWSYSGGALAFAAISALDIACWDIKGKVAGLPVYKLLGGRTNEKLRTYASQIQIGWGKKGKAAVTPEEYAEQAMNAVEDGYDCLKVDPFWTDMKGLCSNIRRAHVPASQLSDWNWRKFLRGDQLKAVSRRVEAIRKAVGDGVDIIIEFHGMFDVNTSIQMGRELDQYGCLYFEEPNSSMNPRFTLEFKNGVRTPVATGERIGSAWGFQTLIETRAVDVAQPDLGVVGGFTEMKKICDFANLHDVGVQIHNMSGPVLCAATLHAETAVPNFVIHENLRWNNLDTFKVLGKYDYQPVNGELVPPELPGIGQELSERAIAESTVVTIQ